MDIEIKPLKDMWVVSVVINKTGNRYNYNSLLYEQPTENQVKILWNENKKHWSKC